MGKIAVLEFNDRNNRRLSVVSQIQQCVVETNSIEILRLNYRRFAKFTAREGEEFMNTFLNNWSPRILSVLRFIAGFLMLWHGSQKLFNMPPSDHPADGAFMIFAGILEFFGGIFVMLGLFTRWAAFLLSGTMAVAYWLAHGTQAFLPIQNKGELAVIYCFVFLYLFFAGGGPWSLDSLIKKNDLNGK